MKTRTVQLGGSGITKRIEIGGDTPVSIQTMWKEGISNVKNDKNALVSIITRLEELSEIGCDLVRFAVPDMDSAESLSVIAKNTQMPLVADIHFDYKLALKCLEGNVAKIRINPGNIGSLEKTKAVVQACKDKGSAIRIGVNSGSLPQDIKEQVSLGKMSRSEGLALTAMREVEIFDKLDFSNVVVSMKASSVKETVDANREFAKRFDIPLHIGVTEAGPLISGIVKSTLAFSQLLTDDIGSTVRVSLSDSPMNEVIAARQILEELGKRQVYVNLVSCPRCGRVGFDVHSFVKKWQKEFLSLQKNITIAVMGCVVNGPGEAKHADLGICGAGDSIMIFKKGKNIHTIHADNSIENAQERLNALLQQADNAFREELKSL